VQFSGKARLRFDVKITLAQGGTEVVEGYTVHAITDGKGKPARPPDWLTAAVAPGEEAGS
jgi:acyl-CoA thioesterase FadM